MSCGANRWLRNAYRPDAEQVGVCYHVLDDVYPDREVDVSVFYTAGNEIVPIDPLPKRELIRLIHEGLAARA